LDLSGKDLTGFDLSETTLDNSNLEAATLQYADLRRSSLREAKLQNSVLRGAKLEQTDIQFADLCGAQGLSQRMLWKAINTPLGLYDSDILRSLGILRRILSKAAIDGSKSAQLHSDRLRQKDLREYDIAGYDLTGLTLISEGKGDEERWKLNHANLQDCLLIGARLTNADLSSCDLTGALLKAADLENADLVGTIFYFAVLHSASLRKAQLSRADLRMADLSDCNLQDAHCEDVRYAWGRDSNEFRQARYYFLATYNDELCRELDLPEDHSAKLSRQDFTNYKLNRANLEGLHLEGGNLSSSTCCEANLKNAKLSTARLQGTNLVGADLRDCDLWQADLTGANLTGAILTGALLNGAILKGIHAPGASFVGADLTDADLSDADLHTAALKGIKLTNANVQGCNFEDVAVKSDSPEPDQALVQLRSTRNHKLAIYSGPVLSAMGLSAADVGDIAALKRDSQRHRDAVRLKRFGNYDLKGANLRDADLSKANLVAADLKGAFLQNAILAGAEARDADFRGAHLSNADLRNTRLAHALFRDADLTDADLRDAQELVAEQLAGTNLTGARLPAEISGFTALSNIKEASSSARTVFIMMLLLCSYSWLKMGSTRDAELFLETSSVSIPVLQIQVSVPTFYMAVPVLLVALFMWCHFYLQHLWEELAELPAIFPDGRPLFRRVYPWLLNTMVTAHFPILKKDRPLLTHLQTFAGVLLAWWVVPATVVAFWWKYLRRHDPLSSTEQLVLAAIAIGAAALLQELAGATLRGETRRSLSLRPRDPRGWVIGSVFLIVLLVLCCLTYAVIREDQRYSTAFLGPRAVAQLAGAEISVRRAGWRGEAEPDRDQVIGAVLVGKDLRGANVRSAFLAGADLRRTDLRYADLAAANLRWADFRESRLAFASFMDADLQFSDLRGVDLQHCNLTGARLHGADLRGADLRFAIGLKSEQIHEAKTDEQTKSTFH
jgi:uncharacterized protein YjbI with pentapeptide repeats